MHSFIHIGSLVYRAAIKLFRLTVVGVAVFGATWLVKDVFEPVGDEHLSSIVQLICLCRTHFWTLVRQTFPLEQTVQRWPHLQVA